MQVHGRHSPLRRGREYKGEEGAGGQGTGQGGRACMYMQVPVRPCTPSHLQRDELVVCCDAHHALIHHGAAGLKTHKGIQQSSSTHVYVQQLKGAAGGTGVLSMPSQPARQQARRRLIGRAGVLYSPQPLLPLLLPPAFSCTGSSTCATRTVRSKSKLALAQNCTHSRARAGRSTAPLSSRMDAGAPVLAVTRALKAPAPWPRILGLVLKRLKRADAAPEAAGV